MVFRELSLPVRLLFYLILIVAAVSILYPLTWMSYTSLKTNEEVMLSPFGLPSRISFANVAEAWQKGNFARLYANSLFIAVASVIGIISVSTTAAYGLARYHFAANRSLFVYFLVGMAVPTQALMVPSFKLMAILESWAVALRLPIAFLNNPLAVILTYMSWSSLAIIFIRAYFMSIPPELEDAARVDGAREFQILRLVMVPLAMPAIATMTIFYFVFFWNDFLWPLIYLQKHTLRTIPLGIMHFEGRYVSLWSLQVAALSLAAWPPIFIYILFHRRIQRGLTEGALKF
ncbi:MAG: carbohydrate ABC transporter permease [Caldilineaceae bacterium]|nr:carbohydrate ABC transporter permease [Caldilineaceae bacterium]MCY4089356.1 carbohydrate ABC transporter permease [Caldilineaceae bacterium]MCY4118606.1 carbohydrate ABC transporter permease [Caldilineaceae bacterium]MDE0072230.1 carbohydrate ABC transporter permease [Caldilineaceae bacterium]MDE0183395.1 carbohydrate ABC transporter permease [Caldilineaceae bacterium]